MVAGISTILLFESKKSDFYNFFIIVPSKKGKRSSSGAILCNWRTFIKAVIEVISII